MLPTSSPFCIPSSFGPHSHRPPPVPHLTGRKRKTRTASGLQGHSKVPGRDSGWNLTLAASQEPLGVAVGLAASDVLVLGTEVTLGEVWERRAVASGARPRWPGRWPGDSHLLLGSLCTWLPPISAGQGKGGGRRTEAAKQLPPMQTTLPADPPRGRASALGVGSCCGLRSRLRTPRRGGWPGRS